MLQEWGERNWLDEPEQVRNALRSGKKAQEGAGVKLHVRHQGYQE
jgi:hypothetical protein